MVVGTSVVPAVVVVGIVVVAWPGMVAVPVGVVVVAVVVVGVPGTRVVGGTRLATGSLPGQASAGAIFDEITRSGVTPSET